MISRYHSNSPPSSTKFYPYIKDNKRISILLSDCNKFQDTLVSTWKGIHTTALSARSLAKDIEKTVGSPGPDPIFLAELAKKKIVQKAKKASSTADIKRKIDSILKSPRHNEKFQLVRSDLKDIKIELDKNLIGFEEFRTPEAKEMLSVNKRAFGEPFNTEFKEPVVSSFKKKQSRVEILKKAGSAVVLDNKVHYHSGTVSKMRIPTDPKKLLKEEDQEMLSNIIKEKRNFSEKLNVQRYLIKKPRKLKLL